MAECSTKRPFIDEDPEDSYESDNDDREDFTQAPESKKSRKHSGAATYRTKFNPEWKKEFPFITSVSNDTYRYA